MSYSGFFPSLSVASTLWGVGLGEACHVKGRRGTHLSRFFHKAEIWNLKGHSRGGKLENSTWDVKGVTVPGVELYSIAFACLLFVPTLWCWAYLNVYFQRLPNLTSAQTNGINLPYLQGRASIWFFFYFPPLLSFRPNCSTFQVEILPSQGQSRDVSG